jgi:hypothetical protein
MAKIQNIDNEPAKDTFTVNGSSHTSSPIESLGWSTGPDRRIVPRLAVHSKRVKRGGGGGGALSVLCKRQRACGIV